MVTESDWRRGIFARYKRECWGWAKQFGFSKAGSWWVASGDDWYQSLRVHRMRATPYGSIGIRLEAYVQHAADGAFLWRPGQPALGVSHTLWSIRGGSRLKCFTVFAPEEVDGALDADRRQFEGVLVPYLRNLRDPVTASSEWFAGWGFSGQMRLDKALRHLVYAGEHERAFALVVGAAETFRFDDPNHLHWALVMMIECADEVGLRLADHRFAEAARVLVRDQAELISETDAEVLQRLVGNADEL